VKRIILFFLSLLLIIGSISHIKGQIQQNKEEISITAHADRTDVPLNRMVDFFITIKWQGEQDRYTIEDFDNPTLTGFEVVKTSSSNIIEDVGGVQYSKKIYSFTLKPQQLGMGYIDGIFLKYTDNQTDESSTIVTKRIGIKVTKPIVKTDYTLFIYIGLVLIIIIAAVYLIFTVTKKRRIEREKLEAEKKDVDIEDNYLELIKEYKPDVSGDLDKFINEISQILNRYLSQKYEFETTGLSKDEISAKLKEKEVDGTIIEKIDSIIEKSDIYRFSGKSIDLSEYESIYSAVESIIEKNYEASKELNQENNRR